MKHDAIGIRLPREVLSHIEKLSKEEREDRNTIIRKLVVLGYADFMKERAAQKYLSGRVALSEAAHQVGLTLWEMERHLVGAGNMVDVLERRQFRHAWSVVSAGLSIKTEPDYQRAVTLLDRLLDEVGENERHPLFGFLDVLGTLIESYESDHVEVKGATGKDVLKSLMEEHRVTQSDLPEVGSQGIVSEILHGRRELNARQIKALSERFGVSPAVFF